MDGLERNAAVRELAFHGRDEWQAGLHAHVLPLGCGPTDARGFSCSAIVTQLCGNRVAELRADACRLMRRESDITERGADLVQVLWQLAGRSRIRQGRHSANLETGAWAVCDAGLEYQLDLEHGARCLLILVPRAECSGWLAAVEALSALALPAGGTAHVAKVLLEALVRDRAPLDGRSERALHDATLALIDQALALEMSARGLSAQTRRPLDFARVQAYVMDRLAEKSLTVERVALAFGMSRRSLYKVFAPFGVTPHAFIQQAKLERARMLLRDPDWRDTSIVRIADHCGFADAAHFSRAFHAHHGEAPNAWRARS